jgi:hypothetical protein
MERCTRIFLTALLVLGAGAVSAHAFTVNGRASTQALWFGNESGTDHFDLAQYVRFFARRIDSADTVRISGYGRAWGDVQQGGGVEARLYYLFLDKKSLVRNTDLRIGRQFFFVSAGSGIVDGLRVDSRPVEPVAVTLVGGRHVLYTETSERDDGGNVAAAVQVSLLTIPQGSADLSYFFTYDQGDRARQILGFAGSKRIAKYGELYTQLRYDFLSDVWNEIQVGARSAVLPKLVMTAEYFRTIPVFDASSIFVVFAVDRFREVMLRGDYALTPKIGLRGEFRNESFGENGTANVGELGVRYRPWDGASAYAAGIWRNGTGGKLAGFELSADTTFKERYLLAAGVQRDVFRRDFMTGDESATRFWVGGEMKVRKNVSAQLRIEDTVSERYSKDVRGRLALNVDF